MKKNFSAYLQTYIERDVKTLYNLADWDDFRDFVGIMSALSAQEVHYTQLARKIDVAGKVVKEWLAMLRQGYQWRSVSAYSGNTIKRLAKKRKGYFIDTGLACYLQQVASPEGLMMHPLRGAFFETMIANTIQALLEALPYPVGVYHWRSDGGAEVDIVLSKDGALYPIEIKMTTRLDKYDARGMKAFRATYAKKARVMPGVIIYAGSHCQYVDRDTIAFPWNGVCA